MDTDFAAAQQAMLAAGCPVFEPGTAEYARGLDRWNSAVTNKPALVARPLTIDDVRSCLMAALANGVPLAVHGAGQDWVGRCISDGGLTLDLSGMRQVSVDPGGRTATIAGGATASDLAAWRWRGSARYVPVARDTDIHDPPEQMRIWRRCPQQGVGQRPTSSYSQVSRKFTSQGRHGLTYGEATGAAACVTVVPLRTACCST